MLSWGFGTRYQGTCLPLPLRAFKEETFLWRGTSCGKVQRPGSRDNCKEMIRRDRNFQGRKKHPGTTICSKYLLSIRAFQGLWLVKNGPLYAPRSVKSSKRTYFARRTILYYPQYWVKFWRSGRVGTKLPHTSCIGFSVTVSWLLPMCRIKMPWGWIGKQADFRGSDCRR